ncbi:hypothetical protein GCM10011418_42540 [Sphingobacterium alkalisoli]|nr:hypothetical protein GCM10011418_42540 [Sphingobacterium alkalisoli]
MVNIRVDMVHRRAFAYFLQDKSMSHATGLEWWINLVNKSVNLTSTVPQEIAKSEITQTAL